MKELGCKAMLVSSACVGEENDSLYSRSIVAAMSSKASKEFKINGVNSVPPRPEALPNIRS